MVEGGDVGAAVGTAAAARADQAQHVGAREPGIDLELEDAVVAGVGHEQPSVRAREHLAWVGERPGRGRRERQRSRASPQPSALGRVRAVELRDDGVQGRRELPGEELAGHGADHSAGRVEDHDRGPRPHAERAPDAELAVVHDGVLDAEALRRGGDVGRHALGAELAGVHADDDQLIRVALFQLPQLRQYVDAVDSAVSPEVEQHQLAAQLT